MPHRRDGGVIAARAATIDSYLERTDTDLTFDWRRATRDMVSISDAANMSNHPIDRQREMATALVIRRDLAEYDAGIPE